MIKFFKNIDDFLQQDMNMRIDHYLFVDDKIRFDLNKIEKIKKKIGIHKEIFLGSKSIENLGNEYCDAVAKFSRCIQEKNLRYLFNTINRVPYSSNATILINYYLKTKYLIENYKDKNLVIFTSYSDLINILNIDYGRYGLNCRLILKTRRALKFFFVYFFVFFKTNIFLLINKINNLFRKKKTKNVFIRTILNNNVQSKSNNYYDYYFRDKIDYETMNNMSVWIDFHSMNDSKIAKFLLTNKSYFSNYDFLSFTRVIIIFVSLLFQCVFFRIKRDDVFIRQHDLFNYLSFFIEKELFSYNFIVNKIHYYSAIGFAQRNKKATIIYPYENRTLEKAMLLGLFSAQGEVKSIGYCHSPIDENHTSIYISKYEKDIVPNPNLILLISVNMYEDFTKNRNYDPHLLSVVGSAKPIQFNSGVFTIKKNVQTPKLLVLLSCDICKNITIIIFLLRTFHKNEKYVFSIRMHPAYPMENKLKTLLSSDRRFVFTANKKLSDDLNTAHLVINGGTSAAAEAIAIGLPVIFIDLKNWFNENILDGCPGLAFVCDNSNDLEKIVHKCLTINENDYIVNLNQSIEYVKNMYSEFSLEKFKKHIFAFSNGN